MEIRVHEERLPGIGMRYDIELGGAQRLFVVAERTGQRHLGLERGGDEPDWQIELHPDQAVMIAALLLGARFTLDTKRDERVAGDEVVVDTVELSEHAPVIGVTVDQFSLPDDEAVVLAVISRSTPELIEDESVHRCQPGDHVVVAARAARIDEVVEYLQGLDTRLS